MGYRVTTVVKVTSIHGDQVPPLVGGGGACVPVPL